MKSIYPYFAITTLLFFIGFHSLNAQEPIRVAAASDLKFALDDIIEAYTQGTGKRVVPIYGSSGKLYEQLSNKAPFHLYMSADVEYPKMLIEKEMSGSELHIYGEGRLVLWSRKFDCDAATLERLSQLDLKKIAIANPNHAPYGMRAKESLEYYKLYDTIRSKIVLGENISQTAQFLSTGAADVGIIALSLALSPTMKKYGKGYYLLPAKSHNPLLQGAIITDFGKGNTDATLFFDFLQSPVAEKIFKTYGFIQEIE
ncbi:molybdate ABC transporter substrate-binding protein [Cyclobacterium marinum]|uniref:molybdate ABC transporter substrate-binding protein n=1 Tax=Cyclobacterium marinum TaxID=104 RepID=UPI0011EE6D9F|nr:molybdate ABC transporter substrate-binding protein [Cyclobacterium marinum]MBI0400634.1 molybdate ABC transporter substrate-binding protein [Cyclobacterium marinum]